MPLYKMILEKEELLKAASESMALKFATCLMNRITEWCTSQEFVNYWALKSEQVLSLLALLVKQVQIQILTKVQILTQSS